jgi:peptidylprolyl isomerase
MKVIRLAAVTVLTVGCMHRQPAVPSPASIPRVSGEVHTAFTQRYIDIVQGTGTMLGPRQCAYAHYTGWLTDGTKFDSSHDPDSRTGKPREPLKFAQGAKRVIIGWDWGFEGMRIGGKRRLFIPYQLAYGDVGSPPRIPPRAMLIFDVELMGVADTMPREQPAARGTPPDCPEWAQARKTD